MENPIFTITRRPIDNIGDGLDFGCNEPTKGMLPPSANRREVLGLLDIVLLQNKIYGSNI